MPITRRHRPFLPPLHPFPLTKKSSLLATFSGRISPSERKTWMETQAVLQLKPIHWSVGGRESGLGVGVIWTRVSAPRESTRMFVTNVAIYCEEAAMRGRDRGEDFVSSAVPARETQKGGRASRQSLPTANPTLEPPSTVLQRRSGISDNHRRPVSIHHFI